MKKTTRATGAIAFMAMTLAGFLPSAARSEPVEAPGLPGGLSLTQPQDNKSPAATDESGEKFTFAVGLQENKTGWHFLYGPMHRPGLKTALFAAKADNGSLVISCRSDGTLEMIYAMAGLFSPVGSSVEPLLSIGTITHPISAQAVVNKDKARETMYYISGTDVLGVVKALAEMNTPHQTRDVFVLESGTHSLKLPSPWPSENAGMMYRLCSVWNDQHIATVTGKSIKSPDGIIFTPHPETK